MAKASEVVKLLTVAKFFVQYEHDMLKIQITYARKKGKEPATGDS